MGSVLRSNNSWNMRSCSPEAAPGTVVEEIQAGYAIGDRVLRPALVAIAKRAKPTVVAAEEPEPKVAAAPEGPES